MRSRARDVVDSNGDWGEGNVQTATISLYASALKNVGRC
jgi:hypothetical protein